MTTRFAPFAAVILVVATLAACGGGGGGGGGGPQGRVADMLISEMGTEDDINVDEACIRRTTGQLSDTDAEAILAAGPDGDPEIGDAAGEVFIELFSCFSFEFED